MGHWRVKIDMEGGKQYTINMLKTRPDEIVADVCKKICGVKYPIFPDAKRKYTVINTKKIIHMSIKEVTE